MKSNKQISNNTSNSKKKGQNLNKAERYKIVAQNRRAYFDYEISDTFEAGLILLGSEIKSVRAGRCSIAESYIAYNKQGDLELINASIPAYSSSSYFNHEERRSRKLLLHKKEISKIISLISKKGFSAIPIKLYFKKGFLKLEMGIGKGKNLVDKRQDIKAKDWKREQAKTIKNYNIKI
ncbi:SsrA-binding protein [Candidatus Hepatincola sp. Av]